MSRITQKDLDFYQMGFSQGLISGILFGMRLEKGYPELVQTFRAIVGQALGESAERENDEK